MVAPPPLALEFPGVSSDKTADWEAGLREWRTGCAIGAAAMDFSLRPTGAMMSG